MIKFKELVKKQESEVKKLRELIYKEIEEKVVPNKNILGALLTGSVARGDARIGPFGIQIDLSLVAKNKLDINLDSIFGVDSEPYIPYHCVSLVDNIGLAIEILEVDKLWDIRKLPESSIFAKNESIILNDKNGILKKWKDECFIISPEQIRERSLKNYFRFCYLTGEYRLEKWLYREAYTQINQNFNEATECYCNFLYSINSSFIPRKDWLTYLTYELEIKPDLHESYMDVLYSSSLNGNEINKKNEVIIKIGQWMENYNKTKHWI